MLLYPTNLYIALKLRDDRININATYNVQEQSVLLPLF